MYLARREFGKALRVYPLKTTSEPRAWPFDGCNPGSDLHTAAAMHTDMPPGGVCATGYTRTEAVANLALAEDAQIDELTTLPGENL